MVEARILGWMGCASALVYLSRKGWQLAVPHIASEWRATANGVILVMVFACLLAITVLSYRSMFTPTSTKLDVYVRDIVVYPIKSCGGIHVKEWEWTSRGLKHDREWMVVDATKSRFVTARKCPQMWSIKPTMGSGVLTVNSPNMEPLTLSMKEDSFEGDTIEVKVWDDAVLGVDQGDKPADWFSKVLGLEVRLVRFAPDQTRKVEKLGNPSGKFHTGFADGYPALVISEESLEDMNAHLSGNGADPLPMSNFRPNLVLRGCKQPFEEDWWKRIKIGTVSLELPKRCSRCKMTTIDADTYKFRANQEPLNTMRKDNYRIGKDKGVYFGQNACAHNVGVVSCGDQVELLQKHNQLTMLAK